MAVDYTRTNWHNRAVQRPRTYVETTNSDNSVTHTPAPGTVAQEGTPLNEDNLNNMEQGIADNNVAIPTQAEVSSGSIVFKNGNNTTVFSVTLPVYDGGVS